MDTNFVISIAILVVIALAWFAGSALDRHNKRIKRD
jgi:hypothetical protein